MQAHSLTASEQRRGHVVRDEERGLFCWLTPSPATPLLQCAAHSASVRQKASPSAWTAEKCWSHRQRESVVLLCLPRPVQFLGGETCKRASYGARCPP